MKYDDLTLYKEKFCSPHVSIQPGIATKLGIMCRLCLQVVGRMLKSLVGKDVGGVRNNINVWWKEYSLDKVETSL